VPVRTPRRRLVPLALFLLVPARLSAAVDAAPRADDSTALLTSLVVTSLSNEPGFEVLASEDVRKQVELEGDRQLAGCEDGSNSCLAELAGALGARVVVYGKLGQLGDSIVLTLNLFDSSDNKAAGRAIVRDSKVDLVANGVPGAVHTIVAAYRADHPVVDETRTRVLVLDIEGSLAPAPPPPAQNTLFVPGVAIAAVGGVLALAGSASLAVSGVTHMQATDPLTKQTAAPGLYDVRDLTGWGGVALVGLGVVGAGVGGGLVVLGGE
jgi:hypothetical protein